MIRLAYGIAAGGVLARKVHDWMCGSGGHHTHRGHRKLLMETVAGTCPTGEIPCELPA